MNIRAGKAFVKLSEKPMTNEERERVAVLKEATRGLRPETYVNIQVKDLKYLTDSILALAPRPEDEAHEETSVIDGANTKEERVPFSPKDSVDEEN